MPWIHNVLNAQAPGEFYDDRDMYRRGAAGQLSDLIGRNKNVSGYLSSGLPYDNEGLLSNFARKYGEEKAMELLYALPTMSKQELMQVEKLVAGASQDVDDERTREYNTYRRAGATVR